MTYFSDLHLALLARDVLERGETLLAEAVRTHGPRWAFGFVRRTYVLLATPWSPVLLASLLLFFFGWLASMRRNVDGARRVVDVSRGTRALPSPRSEPIDIDRTVPFKRQRTSPTSLEGTWRLLAVEGRSEGRIISMPFGRHPVGQLVYLRDGRMTVMLMAAARAKFGSHGLGAGTALEKAAAFDSFLAYTGRYERLEDRVIHLPDVASIPDFVGVPEERFVSLEGDRLILSTPPMLENGQLRTFVIVWQRVSVPGCNSSRTNTYLLTR